MSAATVECLVGPEWVAAVAAAGAHRLKARRRCRRPPPPARPPARRSEAHPSCPNFPQGALRCEELWREAALLERLLYKNAAQHRAGRPFHRLAAVRRLARLLRAADGEGAAARLHADLAPAAAPTAAPHHRHVPRAAAAAFVRRRLLGACRAAEALLPAAHVAAAQLTAQIAQSFFLPLSLTCLAAVARVAALAAQLLVDAAALYSVVAELQALLPGAGVPLELPGAEALPAALRCAWAGGLARLEASPPDAAAAPPPPPPGLSVLGAAAPLPGAAARRRGGAALAVVEDRGVAVSREEFATAAAAAAAAAAPMEHAPAYARAGARLAASAAAKKPSPAPPPPLAKPEPAPEPAAEPMDVDCGAAAGLLAPAPPPPAAAAAGGARPAFISVEGLLVRGGGRKKNKAAPAEEPAPAPRSWEDWVAPAPAPRPPGAGAPLPPTGPFRDRGKRSKKR
jgi:hypothetical protein